MNKRLLIASLLFVLATGFSSYALSNHDQHTNQPASQKSAPVIINNQENQLIFYYGETCPHCHIVDAYVKNNKINQKLNIINKEVYNNQNNAEDLRVKARLCGIPDNALGVPLLWNGQDCLVGDQPIIDFLNEQIKL